METKNKAILMKILIDDLIVDGAETDDLKLIWSRFTPIPVVQLWGLAA